MKVKKGLLLSLSFAGLAVVGLTMTQNVSGLIFNTDAATTTYTLTLDNAAANENSAMDIHNRGGYLKTSSGNVETEVFYSGFTPNTDPVEGQYWGTFADGGNFGNSSPMRGLKSVTPVYSGEGKLSVSFGFEEDNGTPVYVAQNREVLSGVSYAFHDQLPSYLKLVSTGETTIESITFTYNCQDTLSETPANYKLNWYLVGTGSFLDGGATWAPGSGPKFEYDAEQSTDTYYQYKITRTFAAGDVFKIAGSTWSDKSNTKGEWESTTDAAITVGDFAFDGNDGNIEVVTAGEYTIYWKVHTDGGYSAYCKGISEPVAVTRIYLKAPTWFYTNDAKTLNMHYWGGIETSWPGVALTELSTGIYYTDIAGADKITGCLFSRNNGGGIDAQTVDLTFTTDLTKNCYDMSSVAERWLSSGKIQASGEWITYSA